jgi:signal-transduction protein with cAMP-binding, CBS, and nucleotidyltransferase domain
MHAGEIISELVPVVRTSTTGLEALQMMDEARVGHLPIVNNEVLLGLLSEDDVYDLDDPEQPVGNHKLSLCQASIQEHQHIYEAIRVMAEEKLDVLPVTDQQQQYLGSVCIHELLGYFASLSAARNPGGIIVLEVNQNDLVVSEIARIVESNDTKILSMYLQTNTDSTKIEITLKLNRIDIGAVLQTFHRFNYIIKATFTEGEHSDDLKERYDILMRYLNI